MRRKKKEYYYSKRKMDNKRTIENNYKNIKRKGKTNDIMINRRGKQIVKETDERNEKSGHQKGGRSNIIMPLKNMFI